MSAVSVEEDSLLSQEFDLGIPRSTASLKLFEILYMTTYFPKSWCELCTNERRGVAYLTIDDVADFGASSLFNISGIEWEVRAVFICINISVPNFATFYS
jgi:hypothetical protein